MYIMQINRLSKNPVAAQDYCHYEVLSRVTRPFVFVSLKKTGTLILGVGKTKAAARNFPREGKQ